MIWLIGGTVNAREIAIELANKKIEYIATSATEYGQQLMQKITPMSFWKQMDLPEMVAFIDKHKVTTVIDASHPFAKDVSENAILACREKGAVYYRFERKTLELPNAANFYSYDDIVNYLQKTDGNILLTIGSKNLSLFSVIEPSRIFARILSSSNSFIDAENAGFKAHQLLGMKGDCSAELNKALIKEYNIQYVVSKESGQEGGLFEKYNATESLHRTLLILKRPPVDYPVLFHTYSELFNHLCQ